MNKKKPRAPRPPKNLVDRNPILHNLNQGSILSRFFNNAFNDPLYFDYSSDGRFNSPHGAYGVNYAAERSVGAFAETFLRSAGTQSITHSVISSRGFTEILVTQEMHLVMVGGKGLTRIGTTAEITASSPPYTIPQLWSQALHDHPGNFDGLAYYSRHDNSELCFALFERSQSKMRAQKTLMNVTDEMIDPLIDHYQLGLLPF